MNYQKIDPGLAGALEDALNPDARTLVVFIQTAGPPSPDQFTLLRQYGVSDADTDRQIFTVTLSPRAVEELSDQPWVKYLSLSSRLKPLV